MTQQQLNGAQIGTGLQQMNGERMAQGMRGDRFAEPRLLKRLPAYDLDSARRFLRGRLATGDSVVLLAFDGAEALGFTQLYPSFSSLGMARIFILNDLFVAPAGRRSGVGAALLDAAAAFGRASGAVRLTLSTEATNTTAQSLSYIMYSSGSWSSVKTVALSEKLSADAAVAALGRMMNQ